MEYIYSETLILGLRFSLILTSPHYRVAMMASALFHRSAFSFHKPSAHLARERHHGTTTTRGSATELTIARPCPNRSSSSFNMQRSTQTLSLLQFSNMVLRPRLGIEPQQNGKPKPRARCVSCGSIAKFGAQLSSCPQVSCSSKCVSSW